MQTRQRRIRNLVLAVMFFVWGVMRISSAESPLDRWSAGQMVPAVLHFLVAGLFLSRGPASREGSVPDVAAAIPSFVAGGLIMTLAPAPSEWSLASSVVFMAGAAGAITSLLYLGGNFAIFPALREVVAQGPYRLVRHPAYLFEMVMLGGVAITSNWKVWILLPVAIAFFALRIFFEERFLSLSSSYRLYRKSTKFRLVPFVW